MITETLNRQFKFDCDTKNLSIIRGNVTDVLAKNGVTGRDASIIVLAIDETLSAIMLHAIENNTRGDIVLQLDVDKVRCKVTINDETGVCEMNGNGGKSLTEMLTAVTKMKKYQIGLLIMREVIDEIYYNYKRGFQNEIVLLKFLSVKG